MSLTNWSLSPSPSVLCFNIFCCFLSIFSPSEWLNILQNPPSLAFSLELKWCCNTCLMNSSRRTEVVYVSAYILPLSFPSCTLMRGGFSWMRIKYCLATNSVDGLEILLLFLCVNYFYLLPPSLVYKHISMRVSYIYEFVAIFNLLTHRSQDYYHNLARIWSLVFMLKG